ncbi:MAG: ABC-2 transporter permease [Firmicutes bacterium]|nr:ABC-2 transporter permease [Bacillota bacterium]
MKGLLTKDFMLLRNQSRTLLLLLACGIVMSLSFDNEIVIMYLGIMGGMVAVGTLSYDEFDNGYSFLLTLPVTRKTYVREKYLFCVGCTIACALIGIAAALVITKVKGGAAGEMPTAVDVLLTLAATLAVLLIFMSLTIPFRLKYGAEKGRIVLYAFFIGIAALIVLFNRLGGGAADSLPESLNLNLILGALLVIGIIAIVVSEQAAEHIMAKKEF